MKDTQFIILKDTPHYHRKSGWISTIFISWIFGTHILPYLRVYWLYKYVKNLRDRRRINVKRLNNRSRRMSTLKNITKIPSFKIPIITWIPMC